MQLPATLTAKKSEDEIVQPTRYITFFLRRIQRLQIFITNISPQMLSNIIYIYTFDGQSRIGFYIHCLFQEQACSSHVWVREVVFAGKTRRTLLKMLGFQNLARHPTMVLPVACKCGQSSYRSRQEVQHQNSDETVVHGLLRSEEHLMGSDLKVEGC